MNDQQGKATRLYLDLPIIDLVIRPIVESKDLLPTLWRIHRRAEEGKAGSHELTFRVYAERDLANRIAQSIRSSDTLAAPFAADLVDNFSWVEEHATFQECWPEFAMGFSKSILNLIRAMREEKAVTVPNLLSKPGSELIQFYKDIDDEIKKLWKETGAGAFLHQAHAIYGYPSFEAFLVNANNNQLDTELHCIHSPKHVH